MFKRLRNKIEDWAFRRMLKESGVRIDPEPGIWGILDKRTEEFILANLYRDKNFLALMRKYAEGSNKAMIEATRKGDEKQALRFNGQFYSYNSILIRSKRAYERSIRTNNDKTQKQDIPNEDS